ncbi:CCA tRNA nucleotidyltransferase [Legionella anisa]|uniref:CCA tRNA nucleotidyltransferase n=1 Tax=Legionella anisa TaxID=28082 RepID=A0AAX0WSI7_9GAMM|nr:CCA tRNA nucleotidyltransferase [Legionella anisa]AWN74681.1 CCA tRNA nucleotidyltransferase [Legionella anisa]KTC77475.1 multifunctional tRNA nucleotidy [Legionella anisa]MBN5935909.1 CCA tRNA nucleotidyltransferase [Legionella anisa]MCW8425202.1 CCA tRNA nucleotidyltransferase [Legionella anisa]MCW8449379.1 CCA tRNA nucleotidyltransferase [Legionella anisa]
MKIFLVGGAVRDTLRNVLPKDNDWVVVGATWDEMLKLGYKPVRSGQEGKDIPVFLHPETQEEYALARCEKRTGSGHTGFEFDISPTITLIDDLSRRDLTINAMALPFEEGKLGELIDPYNGKADLERHILRHVSPTFVEDPLRLVRTARFAACLGFQVAPETMLLMKQMVAERKVCELSSEQLWKELERALMGAYPENFFDVLKQCGADSILFPNMDISDSSIKALQRAADHKDSAYVRFAVLMHNQSQNEISAFCKQFNIPNQYRDLALLTNKHLTQFRRVPELNAGELLDLLTNIGAFHNKERFDNCLRIFELSTQEPSYIEHVRNAFQAAKSINTKELASKYIGHELNRKIKGLRIEAIQQCMNSSDECRLTAY